MKLETAVITGASTGIGRSIARLFLDKGYNLVINSSDTQKLGASSRVIQVAGDIGNKSTGEKLVSTAVEMFGSVDVLINNAGVFTPKPFLEVEESDLERFLSVNLKGTFFTSQAAIREMIKTGGGSIINIGTVLVDHAIAGFPATAPIASKGGIHALTKQLAAEFGKDNIRVNTIAPGIIRSPLQEKIGIENADDLAGLHLLERIGEPEDVANAAYYLASSNFVTGETTNVGGGHTAGHRFG